MGIIWEEPPPEALAMKYRAGTLGDFMENLTKRPSTWARLDRKYNTLDSARAAASIIRNGVRGRKGFKKGDFEAVAHEIDDGPRVWARYIREKAADVDAGDDGSADEDERRSFPPKVRAWAKLNGIEVKPGRLPGALVQRYVEATGDPVPASRLQAVE